MKLQGMFALAATPFDHTGAIYRTKVLHNFAKWRRTSLAGFIVGSLAGEGALLSAEEKVELVKLAAEGAAAGPLLIGDVTQEGVFGAAQLARAMADAGAHAVTSRPPREYRYLADGDDRLALYFRALADQSPIPVIIYNDPPVIAVAEVGKLAGHPNIVGVVESRTSPARIGEIRDLAGREFGILAGTEEQVWELLGAGANGAALAFAAASPYATIAMWEAFRTREEEAGLDWQARIAHPANLVTMTYGPPGLKHAMDLNGYYGGPPRLPFAPLGGAGQSEIEEAFRDLKG